jgi:hypothetical protein
MGSPFAHANGMRVAIFNRQRLHSRRSGNNLSSMKTFAHPKSNDQSAKSWMQAKILTSLLIERVALCGRFFPPGDMIG